MYVPVQLPVETQHLILLLMGLAHLVHVAISARPDSNLVNVLPVNFFMPWLLGGDLPDHIELACCAYRCCWHVLQQQCVCTEASGAIHVCR